MERKMGKELMNKLIVNDIINDVAIVKTTFGYTVRYGLQTTPFEDDLHRAVEHFNDCLRHALTCQGEPS